MTLDRLVRRFAATALLVGAVGAPAVATQVACQSTEQPPVLMADIDDDGKVDRIRVAPKEASYGANVDITIEIDRAKRGETTQRWEPLAQVTTVAITCFQVTARDADGDGRTDLILYDGKRLSYEPPAGITLYRAADGTYTRR